MFSAQIGTKESNIVFEEIFPFTQLDVKVHIKPQSSASNQHYIFYVLSVCDCSEPICASQVHFLK